MGAAGLRGRLKRFAEPQYQREADDLQVQALQAGATPVKRCQTGGVVCIAGTVRSVRLAPLGGAPTFEVDLYDGSGTVRLVFLGRRQVRGLEVGRSLVARGRLTNRDERPTIFNPGYELLAVSA
jgi:RecG-like helicase